MSRTLSPSSGRPYSLARVCRVWRASRATHLPPSFLLRCGDEELGLSARTYALEVDQRLQRVPERVDVERIGFVGAERPRPSIQPQVRRRAVRAPIAEEAVEQVLLCGRERAVKADPLPEVRDAVLRLLRGEDLETLSRALGATAATLTGWRDTFVVAGEASLATRSADGEVLENERLKAKLGEMLPERELLEPKIAALEANRPLARRARSMHALHAGNGAGRDHPGFLLFTSDAHHDQVAVPGRFGGHTDVSRPAIGEMHLEQDHLVRGAIRDGAAHANHASHAAPLAGPRQAAKGRRVKSPGGRARPTLGSHRDLG